MCESRLTDVTSRQLNVMLVAMLIMGGVALAGATWLVMSR